MEPEKTPRDRAEDLISLLLGWRPTQQQGVWAIRFAVVLVVLVAIGQAYDVTLLDWLKLLIVPAAIAGVGIWFNRQQRERELKIAREQREQDAKIAENRTQDEALQAYLDQMSGMLIPNKDQPSLYDEPPAASLRTVARARTLTILARLAGDRKARVVQFLYEANLITTPRPVVELYLADLSKAALSRTDLRAAALMGANLRGAMLIETGLTEAHLMDADLRGADLSRAFLGESHLTQADLRGAILSGADRGANLRGATLSSADLRGADLSRAFLGESYLIEADLRGADLIEADLRGAILMGAILGGADVSGANFTDAKGITADRLETQAKSLEGATMPNGQKYEDWLKDREDRQEDG